MQNDALALDVREAARRLSISPRTLALLIARGEIQSRKIGRRRIIPVAALEKFLVRDHSTRRAVKSLKTKTPAARAGLGKK
jgi:excisionase family DNA binding protein